MQPRRSAALYLGRSLLGLAASLALVYVGSIYLIDRGEPGWSLVWDGWIYNLTLVTATAASFLRLTEPSTNRRAAAALSVAMAAWTAGNVSWSIWVQTLDDPPYPSIGDAGYLAFYLPAAIGIALAFRGSRTSYDRVALIDALIGGLSVAAVAAFLVLGPVAAASSGTAAEIITNTAYPVGDLLLLALLLTLAGLNGWRVTRMQATLIATLGLFAVADSVYLLRVANDTYVSGTWLDASWLIPLVGIAWSIWQPDDAQDKVQRPRHGAAVLVPVAFLGAALLIALASAWEFVPTIGIAFLGAALMTCGWRMVHTLRVLERLAASERQAREAHIQVLSDARSEIEQANQALERRVAERTAELEAANARLAASAGKLERSNRELQEFAYVASHDLQEPLRKIRTFGSRLQDRYADNIPSEGLDYLDRMQNASGRMSTLIEDLLTFSRVTSHANLFDRVDLTQVARDVIGDLEIPIEESKATITLEPLPSIDADPTQMRQLLQNLLSNAIKFTPEDRAPRIKITSSLVEGSGDDLNAYCRLEIVDNGIGFEDRYLDKIFAVFQRLHGRTEYSGSGIGLAVCRRIAERHNGSITASSEPGEGSTFSVLLPVHQREMSTL